MIRMESVRGRRPAPRLSPAGHGRAGAPGMAPGTSGQPSRAPDRRSKLQSHRSERGDPAPRFPLIMSISADSAGVSSERAHDQPKPTREELQSAYGRVIPDLVGPRPRVLLVGIN